jgi:hypothetical protein
MSLLIPQIVYYFSEHEKLGIDLKPKYKYNFFKTGLFQLPCGISISKADTISKNYFSDLDKKLKIANKNSFSNDINPYETWTEDQFICKSLLPQNYFKNKKSNKKIQRFTNLLYRFNIDPRVQKFQESFKDWLKVSLSNEISFFGYLRINLMENSIMLAKIKDSCIKEFKLVLNCGFFIKAEINHANGVDLVKKLSVSFKGGYK